MYYNKTAAIQKAMEKNERKTFTDDWMFGMVMQDKTICRELLQRILPNEQFGDIQLASPDGTFAGSADDNNDSESNIPDLAVQLQAAMKFDKDSRGVRFDAYVKSEEVWAEIEMQVHSANHLGKRSRYYSANMDIDMLLSGTDYEKLKRSYVIFLCTYDYMKKEEPIYFFQRYDVEKSLPFDDESYILILNTSCDAAKVPDNLKALYAYVNDPNHKTGDDLISRIDDLVDKYNGSEWRRMQMTYEEHIKHEKYLAREEGIKEGEMIGREDMQIEIAAKLKASGMPLADIAKITGLCPEAVEKL